MFKVARSIYQSVSHKSVLFYSTENSAVQGKLKELVNKNKVVVFMKGVPEQPMCGFSNAVCQILRMHGAPYEAHNVLEDESIRQGIKEYSDWPTIPQIYIGGEFVGGCDIMIQMHQSGDLIEELEKVGIKSKLVEEEGDTNKEKETK
ncbi:glutaredoxin-related protein 5, mitochondrial-like [Artemia franciscana]|uniref:glutaredoxin-related protein 5, mitochondrial-like n=1 Tax=Artemia franciscana TaxID=6661 RepID=UPI0032DACB95